MSRSAKGTGFRGWTAASTAKVRAFLGWAITVGGGGTPGEGTVYGGLVGWARLHGATGTAQYYGIAGTAEHYGIKGKAEI